MAVWSELNGTMEIGDSVFNVHEIAGAVKTRHECTSEVAETQRHFCMSIWSELDGTLEVGYCIFKVGKITSAVKLRFKCGAEVDEP